MKNNKVVETAQKGQTTNKIQSENNTSNKTSNKSNVPTGNVKTQKSSEERRKAREEQYRQFRINALKRRAKRMNMSEEDIKKYVEELIKQLDAPKQYSILVMFDKPIAKMSMEAIKNANIEYNYAGETYVSITGDQTVLAKLREIAPPGAKICPYAKKMESVLPTNKTEVIKKPSNNTAEAKAAAKASRRGHPGHGSKHWLHRLQKGRVKSKTIRIHSSEFFMKNGKPVKRRNPSSRKNRGTNSTRVKIGKRAWLKANTTKAVLSLSERVSKQKAITAQLKSKKAATASKTTKKAA